LINPREYRADCWPPSGHLTGAICQVQKTVQKALEAIGTQLSFADERGFETNERAFLYQPKSFVVVGSLRESCRKPDQRK
jgi:hypothetical protein